MTRGAASSLLLVAACAVGCSQASRSPTAPEPAQLPSTARVYGTVLDGDDRPVSGAKLLSEGGPVPDLEGLTDADGRYDFTVQRLSTPLAFTVTKDGFERSWSPLNMDLWDFGEVRTDIRLYAIQKIVAGQSVDILVRQDDPRCMFDPLDTYRCRHLRVVSTARGRLSLAALVTGSEVVEGQPVTVTLAMPPHGGPANTPLRFPVETGTEVAVRINVYGDIAPQRVTLQTTFSR